MNHSLTGKRIALLATDGFEDSELTRPLVAVQEAGAEVTVISNKEGKIVGKDGTQVDVTRTLDGITATDYDALLLPGGVQNPDVMRTEEAAVNFVRDFFESKKPVAAICHAPWMLIEADVIQDRNVTSWPSLKTDLRNAGAKWVDEEVVEDQGLVTSRKPDDLDAFCAKAIEVFAESHEVGQTA